MQINSREKLDDKEPDSSESLHHEEKFLPQPGVQGPSSWRLANTVFIGFLVLNYFLRPGSAMPIAIPQVETTPSFPPPLPNSLSSQPKQQVEDEGLTDQDKIMMDIWKQAFTEDNPSLLDQYKLKLDLDSESATYLFDCVKFNKPKMLAQYLVNGDIDINLRHGDTGDTPLSVAIRTNKKKVFNILLVQPNCNLNLINKKKYAPIDYAIEHNDPYYLRELVIRGVNLNTTENSKTHLMQAVENGYFKHVRILVENNVDLFAKYNGWTAYDLAKKNNPKSEIATYLRERMQNLRDKTANNQGKQMKGQQSGLRTALYTSMATILVLMIGGGIFWAKRSGKFSRYKKQNDKASKEQKQQEPEQQRLSVLRGKLAKLSKSTNKEIVDKVNQIREEIQSESLETKEYNQLFNQIKDLEDRDRALKHKKELDRTLDDFELTVLTSQNLEKEIKNARIDTADNRVIEEIKAKIKESKTILEQCISLRNQLNSRRAENPYGINIDKDQEYLTFYHLAGQFKALVNPLSRQFESHKNTFSQIPSCKVKCDEVSKELDGETGKIARFVNAISNANRNRYQLSSGLDNDRKRAEKTLTNLENFSNEIESFKKEVNTESHIISDQRIKEINARINDIDKSIDSTESQLITFMQSLQNLQAENSINPMGFKKDLKRNKKVHKKINLDMQNMPKRESKDLDSGLKQRENKSKKVNLKFEDLADRKKLFIQESQIPEETEKTQTHAQALQRKKSTIDLSYSFIHSRLSSSTSSNNTLADFIDTRFNSDFFSNTINNIEIFIHQKHLELNSNLNLLQIYALNHEMMRFFNVAMEQLNTLKGSSMFSLVRNAFAHSKWLLKIAQKPNTAEMQESYTAEINSLQQKMIAAGKILIDCFRRRNYEPLMTEPFFAEIAAIGEELDKKREYTNRSQHNSFTATTIQLRELFTEQYEYFPVMVKSALDMVTAQGALYAHKHTFDRKKGAAIRHPQPGLSSNRTAGLSTTTGSNNPKNIENQTIDLTIQQFLKTK